MGDFNFREIDCDAETSNVNENHIDTKNLGIVRDNFLFQHVEKNLPELEKIRETHF